MTLFVNAAFPRDLVVNEACIDAGGLLSAVKLLSPGLVVPASVEGLVSKNSLRNCI